MVNLNTPNRGDLNVEEIEKILNDNQHMKFLLTICAACGMCKKSCFKYMNTKDATYTPSYKAIQTLGVLFKKKGRVSEEELQKIGEIALGKCGMCRRCYCPFGIEISSMIAVVRSICRNNGVYERDDTRKRVVRMDSR